MIAGENRWGDGRKLYLGGDMKRPEREE